VLDTLLGTCAPSECSVIISSFDEETGPHLHAIEPSRVCYVSANFLSSCHAFHACACLGLVRRYFATAIGKNKHDSSSELEKLDFTKLTVAKGVKHATYTPVQAAQ
jgi:hypothetical protein